MEATEGSLRCSESKVQLHYQLARLPYSNQTMSIYIDQFQTIFHKLADISSLVDDDAKVSTLLASFGDKSKSPYGQLVTALQTGENSVSWNTPTARLLQEFHEKSMSATTVGDRNGGSSMALDTRQRKKLYTAIFENKTKGKKKIEMRRCFECQEVGHIARNCPKRKNGWQSDGNGTTDASANHASMLMAIEEHGLGPCMCHHQGHDRYLCPPRRFDQIDKEIRASDKTVSVLFKDSTMLSTRIAPDHKFLLDSGASGHMV